MHQVSRRELNNIAKEHRFVRDTLEKMIRLAEVLTYLNNELFLSESLALKGGTAINLTIFNLPRLSVDIDLDYCKNVTKEEMLADRKIINELIGKYMFAKGYALSPKTKNHHALDSMVYEYINSGRVKDNIKIEINYMLRCHIFPPIKSVFELPWSNQAYTVTSINPIEIFSAKTVALLNRSAPRDLYDIYNMFKYKMIKREQEPLFKKGVMFYSAISSQQIPERFEYDILENITPFRIKTELLPVLRGGEYFDYEYVRESVRDSLSKILIPNEKEMKFWNEFKEGEYQPEYLFEDIEIINRIKKHPMAIWKCRE